MEAPIKFGTDGWRAIIADTFTFHNVERVAQAAASYWKRTLNPGTEPRVIVGYDRRFMSDRFAQRTAEIMAGNGLQVLLTDRPTPTPTVSYAVEQHRATGGVMITASHNPPAFNGFKLKAHFGGSADSALCNAIEAEIDREPARILSFESARKSIQVCDLRPAHFQAVKRHVDFPLIRRSRIRFAHDAMFGVGAGCFEEILAGTNCRLTALRSAHDPAFGGVNPEPISQNYDSSAAFLRKHPQQFCLVTDGDADRVGGMDGRGNPLTTHQIICLLLRHLIANRNGKGRVVKALTTTSMVDKICAAAGLELVETGVGFKYVCAEMLKGDVLLGFEESGGIGFQGHIPERDAILAGLMMLELLATERLPLPKLLDRLTREFGSHRYGRVDTHFPLEKRSALMEFCKTRPPAKLLQSPIAEVKSFDGVKYVSRDGSWLMLRGSGTEPILRIYAEAASDAAVRKLLQLGQRLTREV